MEIECHTSLVNDEIIKSNLLLYTSEIQKTCLIRIIQEKKSNDAFTF